MTPAGHTRTEILARLAGFFGFLRAKGLAVGVGAEVDLGAALRHVDLLDPNAFRDACRATLAKSPGDVAILDAAFDAYWFAPPLATETVPPGGALPPRPPADGRTESVSIPPAPTGRMVPVEVRIGTYSPEAPPGGHPLSPVDVRRLAAMRAGARRFRRAFSTLPGRRSEPASRGRLDLRRTLHHSGRTAGEWIELLRARRREQRADLIVLWDVSGSMRDHDAALAALVYSLQRIVRRTRVFAFSTEIREITSVLAGTPYGRSLGPLARVLGPAGGGTRIGRCLADFRRDFGRLVHTRTTVIVLSDGWDLGETDRLAREVEWLHARSHRVVWVNPYSRDLGFRPETAGMRSALPFVDLLAAPADFESPAILRLAKG